MAVMKDLNGDTIVAIYGHMPSGVDPDVDVTLTVSTDCSKVTMQVAMPPFFCSANAGIGFHDDLVDPKESKAAKLRNLRVAAFNDLMNGIRGTKETVELVTYFELPQQAAWPGKIRRQQFFRYENFTFFSIDVLVSVASTAEKKKRTREFYTGDDDSSCTSTIIP